MNRILDNILRKISKTYDEKRRQEIHDESIRLWRADLKAMGAHPSLWDPDYVYVPEEEVDDGPDPYEYWGVTP